MKTGEHKDIMGTAGKKIVEEQGKLENKPGMNIFFIIDSLGQGGVEKGSRIGSGSIYSY